MTALISVWAFFCGICQLKPLHLEKPKMQMRTCGLTPTWRAVVQDSSRRLHMSGQHGRRPQNSDAGGAREPVRSNHDWRSGHAGPILWAADYVASHDGQQRIQL
jgi:hypothetical protein